VAVRLPQQADEFSLTAFLNNKYRKIIMPKTIARTYEGQIIGGTFSNRKNADKAVAAFEDLAIPLQRSVDGSWFLRISGKLLRQGDP
jgi:hypothetical protein